MTDILTSEQVARLRETWGERFHILEIRELLNSHEALRSEAEQHWLRVLALQRELSWVQAEVQAEEKV